MNPNNTLIAGEMSFTYDDEYALVSHLLDNLEQRLAGRQETRIIRILPSDHCHLGVLGPRDPNVDEPEPLDSAESEISPTQVEINVKKENNGTARNADPSQNQSEDSDITVESLGQTIAEQQGYGRDSTRRPPSSLGFEIVALPSDDIRLVELKVDISFYIYTQHFPNYEEQRQELGTSQSRSTVSLLEVFIRRLVRVPTITIRIDTSKGKYRLTDAGIVQQSLNSVLDEAVSDTTVWRSLSGTATVPSQALADTVAFTEYLRSIANGPVYRPPIEATLDIRVLPTKDRGARICCYLCNQTPRDIIQPYRNQHNILADCEVKGTLSHGTLMPVELIPVPQDYQFDRSVWAIGHGVSTVVSEDHRIIKTEALARYSQPRRATNTRPQAKFDDIFREPYRYLEEIRRAMVKYSTDWQKRIINENTLNLNADELVQCQNDLHSLCDEHDRFAAGIAALKSDERLLQAFRGMNNVFQRTAAGKYDSWHLFQIVFIVTQLSSLVIREGITEGEWPQGKKRNWSDTLDCADVLWFPTGGGKTEAYLGLICCASLYDRLRGKKFGVTAWLRFPLRMLSVQQLQRAVKILWETEMERKSLLGSEAILSEPISLGYFVGKSSTPNQLGGNYAGEWSFDNLESDQSRRDKLLLVSNCPACQGIGTVQIQIDRTQLRIRHVCSKCNTELPVYVSDDEVYRFLPTVVVGTIDKMATIAYSPKLSMLWGGAAWRCPENNQHGFGIGDWCVNSCPTNPRKGKRGRHRTLVTPYDPVPSFHIQDELHLLQQELGAFAGHYETLVRSCEAAVGKLPTKVIAATATIEGYQHQVRQIYGVHNARRFPSRGYDLMETFYTTADSTAKNTRLYVAFRPPHLQAADAASLCIHILQEEINKLYSNPEEALEWLPNIKTAKGVTGILYYYSTILAYVGSKARGVRIRQALDKEASILRPGNMRELNTEFLSGDSTLASIAETIRKVERPPEWTSEDYLDITVATSVISHGVDVDRFNLMVLDSIPEETSDYIQASSRSGRRHLGLVLSVLAPYSLRASSIYHRFKEYHQHMERLVSPVAVNRFAKYAAMRTAPGVLIGILLGRYGALAHSTEFTRRNVVVELLTPGAQSTLPFHLSPEDFYQALVSAYALGLGIYPPGLELILQQELKTQIERFIYIVRGSHRDKLTEVVHPSPMTSLRDVDVGVSFRPDDDISWQDLRWFNTI